MIKPLEGQSLFDIALQHTGDFTKAFDIAMMQNLSLTNELNLNLVFDNMSEASPLVVDYFLKSKKQPATMAVKQKSELDILPMGFPLSL